MSSLNDVPAEEEFLAKCEEELKHRFSEQDEEYMKVFNSDLEPPPIVDPWWVSNNSGRRNNRGGFRRYHPYDRSDNRRNDRQDNGRYERHDNRKYDRQNDQRDDRNDRQGHSRHY